MKRLLLIFIPLSLLSQEIELFIDWQPAAKGQESFPLPPEAKEENLAMLSLIRHRLQKKGWEIRSWEYETYLPSLISWKKVHSKTDFLNWIYSVFRSPSSSITSDYWIFWGLGPIVRDLAFNRTPKEKMVLFMWEPPVVQPETHDLKMHRYFGKIFTWDDDLVDNIRYFKFHYPVLQQKIPNIPSFEEKKFCTLINSRLQSKHPKELYSAREEIIRFFENRSDEFDLYGRFWEKRNYKNYRGNIADKMSVLKNYKFSICYENTQNIRGYITEKIFDCFAAGVIPVYWGADNICDYIPKNCFIDRREFQNNEDLVVYLHSISKETYQMYLENIDQFLKSEQAKIFSVDHFVNTVLQCISPNS